MRILSLRRVNAPFPYPRHAEIPALDKLARTVNRRAKVGMPIRVLPPIPCGILYANSNIGKEKYSEEALGGNAAHSVALN
jgi:hypothetical protein